MPARTQEERKAQTRSQLVAAAADLFARKGFHAVSAEAVAGAADRTTGALYSHFGGKEGLLLALVEQWLDESAARILVGVEEANELDGRLAAMWEESLAPGAGDDDATAWLLLEFELWLYAARNPDFAGRLATRYAQRRASLAEALDEWTRAEGLGPLEHPERTAGLVIALLLGAAMQHHLEGTALRTTDVVTGLRAVLEGDT